MTDNEHVYAICFQPVVAGDVIFGENIKTIEGYALLNSEAAIFSSFRENQNRYAIWPTGELNIYIKPPVVYISPHRPDDPKGLQIWNFARFVRHPR